MAKAIYPGSFDPVTKGHLDIIRRASQMFDELTVSILNNSNKIPLFSVDERVKMLQSVCSDIANVKVDTFSGLTAEYARRTGTDVIIRGLRAVTDFEYELQMAQTNRKLLPRVDTVFLTTSLEYAYLSSSTVREVALYGGDISEFVPPLVAEEVYRKLEKAD
ncbi:MAG: pantetheine-phosphate adenylyltransferase [Lachnospiraceae bacterium]|nr:pantetheine-phosphate adenylyltransferase [Lachnospiraceae bacterium]